MSPGLLSAGLGSVPAQQTYLDVGQGNRIFDSLYDVELPALSRDCLSWLSAVDRRAESAPAEIVPALLTNTLIANGVAVFREGKSSCAFGGPPGTGDGPVGIGTMLTAPASSKTLRTLLGSLHPDDLLIAIEQPPPEKDRALAIGIAGSGFDGNLTSDSTRLDGYVLSTDIAPTILRHLGVDVPSEMSGQPSGSEIA